MRSTTSRVREHVRGCLRAAFVLHDQATAAIAADEPAECMQGPAPAPTSNEEPYGWCCASSPR